MTAIHTIIQKTDSVSEPFVIDYSMCFICVHSFSSPNLHFTDDTNEVTAQSWQLVEPIYRDSSHLLPPTPNNLRSITPSPQDVQYYMNCHRIPFDSKSGSRETDFLPIRVNMSIVRISPLHYLASCNPLQTRIWKMTKI